EEIRLPQILGEDDELRTEKRGEHAANEHPGDGLRAKTLARGIRGSKAVGLMRSRIQSAAQRPEQQQRERGLQHGGARDETGKRAEYRTGLQREATAVAPRQDAD